MKKLDISKEELRELYLDNGLTTYEIAKLKKCSQATIWKKLKRHNIPAKTTERKDITKKILQQLYIKENLSTWQIEKITGFPRSTVYRRLKKYNILIRNISKSHIKYNRTDFSNNNIEKAYLIGFRIGGLRVRKKGVKSETIKVGCGSTKQAQVDLITKLFEKYGNVWKKKTEKGKINVEVGLNETFSFLLKKEAPEWIFKQEKTFYAFLSGFIDAEGSISMTKKRAYLSIGNYDYKLLQKIYITLNFFGVVCNKPIEDKRKGKFNNEGYTYNQNYWHFRIVRKKYLLKLLKKIKPYIKHSDKKISLQMAIENIKLRNKLYGNKDL